MITLQAPAQITDTTLNQFLDNAEVVENEDSLFISDEVDYIASIICGTETVEGVITIDAVNYNLTDYAKEQILNKLRNFNQDTYDVRAEQGLYSYGF